MKKLGFGKKHDGLSPEEWASHYQKYLHEYTFYRPMRDINSIWQEHFKKKPESLAYDHMVYRFSKSKRFSKIIPFGKNPVGRLLFETACHMRGARVLKVQKESA